MRGHDGFARDGWGLAHTALVLRAQWEWLTRSVGVLSVAFCCSISSGRLAAFVEEVFDAVLNGGSFGWRAWLAGPYALAVLNGCGFDSALFFAEASAF